MLLGFSEGMWEGSEEKRDRLGVGLGWVGCCGRAVDVLVATMGFFFGGFLATDSGLNIMAFPCFFGSSCCAVVEVWGLGRFKAPLVSVLVLAGGPTLVSGGWSPPPVSALSSVF